MVTRWWWPSRRAGWSDSGTSGPSGDADLEPTTGQLITLYVEPGWWGTGVGRAVHDAALDRLARRGVDRVVLWVLSTNARARRFYERQGWRARRVLRVQQFGGAVVIDHRLSRAVRPGVSPAVQIFSRPTQYGSRSLRL